jgi:hypothetical protein
MAEIPEYMAGEGPPVGARGGVFDLAGETDWNSVSPTLS